MNDRASDPSPPPGVPARRRGLNAFTIVETMVAVAVCAVTLSAFFMTTAQAVRLARSGRETALASELIEQRLSAVRSLSPWLQTVTIAGVTSVMSSASPAAASFPPVAESVTVAPWPANGDYFTVSRSAAGAVSTAGASLPNSPTCIQVKVQITWTTPNQQTITRATTTLLAKGGL